MTAQEVEKWLISHGYVKDAYGNYKKEVTKDGKTKLFRFKLQKSGVRFERKTEAGWVKLRSGNYKRLRVTADGKLSGLV